MSYTICSMISSSTKWRITASQTVWISQRKNRIGRDCSSCYKWITWLKDREKSSATRISNISKSSIWNMSISVRDNSFGKVPSLIQFCLGNTNLTLWDQPLLISKLPEMKPSFSTRSPGFSMNRNGPVISTWDHGDLDLFYYIRYHFITNPF